MIYRYGSTDLLCSAETGFRLSLICELSIVMAIQAVNTDGPARRKTQIHAAGNENIARVSDVLELGASLSENGGVLINTPPPSLSARYHTAGPVRGN